tara:strand:+ start:23 stop:904 length:882 start_codon:yes stop_codon:yes gene_type:complete
MKKILILGGNGFFGAAFCEYINSFKRNLSYKVYLYSKNSSKISKFINNQNIFYIKGNILNYKLKDKFDYVIYAAKSKNAINEKKIINSFYKTAKKYFKNSKIIFLSSGAVYGPVNEFISTGIKEVTKIDMKKINQYTTYKKEYAKYKFFDEKIMFKLSRTVKNICILRCFSFIGKSIISEKGYFISDLINNRIFNKVNKNVFRSYLHQYDLIKIVIKIMKYHKGFEFYNLGSEKIFSLKNVYQILIKYKKNYSNNIKFYEGPIDFYVPNIIKLKKKYKIKKFISLKNFIKNEI